VQHDKVSKWRQGRSRKPQTSAKHLRNMMQRDHDLVESDIYVGSPATWLPSCKEPSNIRSKSSVSANSSESVGFADPFRM
jgi:hypothetical protein